MSLFSFNIPAIFIILFTSKNSIQDLVDLDSQLFDWPRYKDHLYLGIWIVLFLKDFGSQDKTSKI